MSTRDEARETLEWKNIFNRAYKFADPDPNWRDELYRKSEAEFAADFIIHAGYRSAWVIGEQAGLSAAQSWTAIDGPESLPKEDGRYDVTVRSPPYGTNQDPKNNKLSELDFKVGKGWSLYKMAVVAEGVIAWRPRPQPYSAPSTE